MELKRTEIQSLQKCFSDTREHTVECDVLLPDYYPEIDKIISCSLTPTEDASSISGDKLSVAGNAGIQIIYWSAEQRPVSVFHNSKYTKLISCPGGNEENFYTVSQSVVSLNCRASGPRKLEIRAVIAMKSEIYHRGKEGLISEITDGCVQTDVKTDSLLRTDAFVDLSCEIRSSIALPVSKEHICAVLCKQAEIQISEAKSVSNKVMLKGAAQVTLSAVTDDGNILRDLRFHLPFTEIKDAYGVREESLLRYCVRNPLVFSDLQGGTGENETETELCVRFDATVFSASKEDVSFVRDAYALRGETETKQVNVSVPERAEIKEADVPFSLVLDLDAQNSEILCATAARTALSISEEQAGMRLGLQTEVGIYLREKEGRLRYEKRTVSEESPVLPMGGETLVFLNAEVSDLRADLSGQSVRVTGRFHVNGFCIVLKHLSFLSDFSASPSAGDENEKMILYYADAGERLWDIAKTYKTDYGILKALNEVESDRFEQNRLIVFSSKGSV